MKVFRPLALLLLVFLGDSYASESHLKVPLKIAVASNFSHTAAELVKVFEQTTGFATQLRLGSTGKITSQIEFGLDVDVFMAADSERPAYLINKGLVPSQQALTYAIGRLVLWSPKQDKLVNQSTLNDDDLNYLAMANPRLAPYGRAAQEVIEALGLRTALEGKTVFGENVSQALQFARSSNAEYAFIAHAQFVAIAIGSAWLVPNSLHQPIEQQAVQVSESAAAKTFMRFLESEAARAIVVKHGYESPNG